MVEMLYINARVNLYSRKSDTKIPFKISSLTKVFYLQLRVRSNTNGNPSDCYQFAIQGLLNSAKIVIAYTTFS